MKKFPQEKRDKRLEELIALGLLFDEEDRELLRQYTWSLNGNGYPQANLGRRRVVQMHNLLLGPPPEGMISDHENRIKLDNRRENLRFVTRPESQQNRGVVINAEYGWKYSRTTGRLMPKFRKNHNG